MDGWIEDGWRKGAQSFFIPRSAIDALRACFAGFCSFVDLTNDCHHHLGRRLRDYRNVASFYLSVCCRACVRGVEV